MDGRVVPRPPLGPAPPRWAPDRLRLALGVGLVVVLAVAWIALGSRGTPADGPPDASAAVTADARAPSTTGSTRVTSVPRWVPPAIASTCRARTAVAPAMVVVDCTPGRGIDRLRYRSFTTAAALDAAYAAGGAPRGGAGTSRCARGERDERAWSGASGPGGTAGRYRCTRSRTRARIVWTDEATRVVAFATRTDGDLRSLYAWWTTVPGPNAPAAAR